MTASQLIRVMIVDDHPLAQTGTRHFLNAYPDFELVGTAGSGEEAIELCARVTPDVVLMDVMMPEMDGIAATRALKQRCPEVRVLMLTSFSEGDVVQRALQAGASGFLMKNVSAMELAAAVRAAYEGRPIMAPEATAALISAVRAPASAADGLTEREREVLQLLAQGLTNSQIAERLTVSRATVKFHIGGLFAKLGVSNRAEAIALAYQRHLV